MYWNSWRCCLLERSEYSLTDTWDVLKPPRWRLQLGGHRLTDTWDVLKQPNCSVVFESSIGLTDTWDVLKLIEQHGGKLPVFGLTDTWDVLKLFLSFTVNDEVRV